MEQIATYYTVAKEIILRRRIASRNAMLHGPSLMLSLENRLLQHRGIVSLIVAICQP